MQRLLVVVNRAAGTTDDDSLQAALTVLRSGADVTVLRPRTPTNSGGW
jgi:hypothetical protein